MLDHEYNLKIADFGFASPLEGEYGDSWLTTFMGTPNHMAPEILEKKKYRGDSVDIFSSGVVLFMLVSQCQPFGLATMAD